MAGRASFQPEQKSSGRAAAPPQADGPSASPRSGRSRVVGGPLRPSQVPLAPAGTAWPAGSPSSPAGEPASRLLRPSGAPAVPARPVPRVLPGPGRPLAAPVREEMEARFRADLSDVRLHAGPAARAAAAALGARAYTAGSHIVIGGDDGARVLAHELAHVVQQRVGAVPGTRHPTGLSVSDPSGSHEKAAEATAAQAMRSPLKQGPRARSRRPARAAGHRPPAPVTAGATIQRLLVAQVTSPDGEKVGGLNLAGRPKGPYGSTMGDHSTAFAVQAEAVRRRVLGLDRRGAEPGSLTAAQAAEEIMKLTRELEKLPGFDLIKNLPAKQQNDLKDARDLIEGWYTNRDSMSLLQLQKMIGDFLHYRELIPLSTINVKEVSPATTGKAKGEGGHREVLAGYASKTPEELQPAVLGMLDKNGIAEVATQWEQGTLARLAPGMTRDQSQEDRAEMIAKQHVMSMEMAYPGVIAKAWPATSPAPGDKPVTSEDLAVAAILNYVNPAIEERRKKNKDGLLHEIITLNEQISGLTDDLPLIPKRQTAQRAKKQEALRAAQEKLKEREADFKANGGTDSELASTRPKAGSKRKPQPKKQWNELEEDPSLKKGKAGAADKESAEAAKAEEDAAEEDPGEAALTPATGSADPKEAEEDAAEEESRNATLTSQLKLKEDGTILDVLSAGRSRSPLPGATMGAHTTAWIVHIDVIRHALRDKTVPDAIKALKALKKKAEAASDRMAKAGFEVVKGNGGELTKSHGKLDKSLALAQDAKPAAQPILLQQAINDLLTYVNYIPGATVEAGDTGGRSEGSKRGRLLRHEDKTVPMTRGNLRADLLGLLDIKAVHDEKQRHAAIQNHLSLISEAYPDAYKESGLAADKDKPENVAEEWLKLPENKEVYWPAKMDE